MMQNVVFSYLFIESNRLHFLSTLHRENDAFFSSLGCKNTRMREIEAIIAINRINQDNAIYSTMPVLHHVYRKIAFVTR